MDAAPPIPYLLTLSILLSPSTSPSLPGCARIDFKLFPGFLGLGFVIFDRN
jgi:hypothetical protein